MTIFTPADHGSARAATRAYETLAPFYDRFMAGCRYGPWLDGIEEWALAAGLRGNRLLDAACGTGKSFEPMLGKGYRVTAFDISPAMVEEARRRAAKRATVIVGDMRDLPWDSRFDLVTCIDDAINYLLTEDDLLAALRSMRRSLRPGGILVFDTNSLNTFRTTFAEEFETRCGDTHFRWRGEAHADFPAGSTAAATIEITAGTHQTSSWHLQRHWTVAKLRETCRMAGLTRITFRGQMPGCRLMGDPDEDSHTKILCLAARPIRGGAP
ncbi:MAG TPA: class I SAM-dependent methyltransferase [Thermoleophilaceae bacterium]|nr:class I SAM-dependent methyltransferase [Thermoleophilaceae bacterium]